MTPPETHRRCRWLVSGKVQGVGFRWFVARIAAKLPVTGWVANRQDGRVEVVAEGPDSAIRVLEQALGSGPESARVDSVEKSELPPETGLPNTFEMR